MAASLMSEAKIWAPRAIPFSPRYSCHDYGNRVSLLSGGASRHPDPNPGGSGSILNNCGEDDLSQRIERVGLAEEAGHTDEEVSLQQTSLAGIIPELGGILFEARDVPQRKAAHDPALNRRFPVERKVDSGPLVHHRENVVEARCSRRSQ